MPRRVLLAVLSLALTTGCMAFTRTYYTPLATHEGQTLVPALVSTARNMGLTAYNQGASASVELEDGTKLSWHGEGDSFVLGVGLPTEGGDVEGRLREAKTRADQIWELAVQARQASFVGVGVAAPPPPPPPMAPGPGYAPPPPGGNPVLVPPSTGYGPPPAGARPTAQCTFDRDCGGGRKCRGGVCQGGPGAPCTFSTDCPGGSCRGGVCQGGGPGAPCTFSTDCPSGTCRFGRCQ